MDCISVNRQIGAMILSTLVLLSIGCELFGQEKEDSSNPQSEIRAISRAQAKRVTTFSQKALIIGNHVPDIVMHKVFNYPGGKAKLSDFKGKHILLDFWSRGCGSCIGAFPKMEQLQKKFADRLQILAVCTYNTWEFLNMNEPGFPKKSTSVGIRNTTLPLVFNSQEMVDYFPHRAEPYVVWIDTRGVVRAMIDAINVNEEMITTLLSGKYDAYPLAESFKRVHKPQQFALYDVRFPILEEGNGRQISKIVYLKRSSPRAADYVILAKLGRSKLSSPEYIYDSATGKQMGQRGAGLETLKLFCFAYQIDPQLIVIESLHPEKYYQPTTGAVDGWLDENIYSYEVCGATEESRQILLREALKDYFKNIEAVKEKRKIRCLELRRNCQDDKLKTRYPDKRPNMERSAALFSFTNYAYSAFVQALQGFNRLLQKHNTLPIFDMTGFHGNNHIDIELRNLKDIIGLNAQLQHYGLVLKEAEREEEVLVLKDVSSLN